MCCSAICGWIKNHKTDHMINDVIITYVETVSTSVYNVQLRQR